jgi:hypothetical protein
MQVEGLPLFFIHHQPGKQMSTSALSIQPSAPAAGFGLLMSPQTIEQVQTFCTMLSKTDFVPKAFRGKPDSIMVVGAMGARLGVDVFSAMAGIADINGRPSVWGDLLLAVCMNNPHFEDCLESFEGKPYEDTFRAVCIAKRKGREPIVRSFSVIEAKEAGLWKKEGPWSKTPQRQMQMRARAFALRDTFADTLAGFKMAEEMADADPIDVTSTATVHDEPKPGKVRTVKDKAPTDAQAKTVTDAVTGLMTTAGATPDEAAKAVESIAKAGADKDESPQRPLTSMQKAEAMDAAAATCDLIYKRCAHLSTLTEPKQAGACLLAVIKEHNAKWQIRTVSDLGGETDDSRKLYLVELEQRVAAWSAQFAKGVEL